MAEYESVLCVKPTVHVFRIPPRPSNRGYRASDWKLDQPDWTGRMRVVAKGRDLSIKLEDKTSGELFARCPIEQYPSIAVESVMDSSRYFVLRIMDDNGRSAFIGIGFEDRGDSFDLNVALQDHFKHIKQEKDAESAEKNLEKGPKLDLGFKEGQTIRINISTKKNTEENGSSKKSRPRAAGGGGGLGFLPPPPGASGGIKIPPPGGPIGTTPPSSIPQPQSKPESQQAIDLFGDFPSKMTISSNASSANSSVPVQTKSHAPASNVDLLLDLGSDSFSSSSSQSVTKASNQGQSSLFDPKFDLLSGTADSVKPAGGSADPWGDFTSASSSSSSDTGWVNFA
ncbi:LOW QUALITY PROTEIN: adaptin ear-binding coat-associated protein 2-like [Mya arenaria]|uniref:LOW QUALITY PROTEIN: adaptin ear-binding coat-associated protein 2-like n=1 Tax=Mya arenaria TaxID=6604 RepID=UPI0022E363DE|nr:LOW QUALITY PROTEIN: adaptin ear-binding coat-associated protein 2-like [Mya arenaria]